MSPSTDLQFFPPIGNGSFGIIHNPRSFITTPIHDDTRRPFLGWSRLPNYDFRNGHPVRKGLLTYWHPDGFYVQPDLHFVTDFNTYPAPVQIVIPRDRYAIPSLFHDSGCEHKGRWLSVYIDGPYQFEACPPAVLARDFGLMMRCCGSWEFTARSFAAMVSRFGPQW
jgi:hypothetical protein